jgi:hypothetical protein
MAANYVLLEKITVGAAGVASVTFNSIPQTGYTDLKVVGSIRTNRAYASDGVYFYFNSDTTSGNYSGKQLTGTGSAVQSTSYGYNDEIMYASGANATVSTFGNCEIIIPNYTSSNQKTASIDSVSENNATLAYSNLGTYKWTGTAAITAITFKPVSGTAFVQYSTFYLYGLAAVGTTPVIAPYASGGDIIQTDGTYWYHAFLSTGSFTPAKALSCDVLVVAGGGSGTWTGGGGAGGLVTLAAQSFANGTSYTATVGGGGAKPATNAGANGNSGTNSQIGSLNSAIGGGGGGYFALTASTGGSGGGGADRVGSTPVAGGASTQTGGYGFAGGAGNGDSATYTAGGGGGGAGSVGSNAASHTGGAGGAGKTTSTEWGGFTTALTLLGLGVSNYLAGGGGGASNNSGDTQGAAGSGGAGAGAFSTGGNATVNTGSGGGGSGTNPVSAGSGGSGVVILRYAI